MSCTCLVLSDSNSPGLKAFWLVLVTVPSTGLITMTMVFAMMRYMILFTAIGRYLPMSLRFPFSL